MSDRPSGRTGSAKRNVVDVGDYEPTSTPSGACRLHPTTTNEPGREESSSDKYAGISGATKGILIEKAGSQYSSLSLLQNSIQTQLNAIDTTIDSLNDKLNDQIDRYTSKFSKLEVLINQMNAQSSYFAGMTGSSY